MAVLTAGTLGAQAQILSLMRDTEIENLLKDYSRPIFRAAGLGSGRMPDAHRAPREFNAFVLDGGNVFIHTGALQQSETPNQVIGVIAHEAGHIAGGHLAQLRERIARDQTKSLLIKLLGIGMMIAGGGGAGATGAGAGVMMGGDELLMRSTSRRAARPGIGGRQSGPAVPDDHAPVRKGMLETFERFAQQEYISASGATQDAFARSHPVAANRLCRSCAMLVAKSPFATKDPPALQLRHDLMRAKIAGYLERPRWCSIAILQATTVCRRAMPDHRHVFPERPRAGAAARLRP